MKLKFAKDAFNLNAKTILKNDNDETLYECIYDFSYKKRIRILDNNVNEIAYIQFKVLSDVNEIGLYDKNNTKLAYIKMGNDINNTIIEDDGWKYLIEDNSYKVIDKNNIEIMNVSEGLALINDDNNILKCIMCLYVFANTDELTIS